MQSRALIFTATAMLAATTSALVLAACGGGGGGGSVMPPAPSPSPSVIPSACHQTVLRPAGMVARQLGHGLFMRPPAGEFNAFESIVPGVVAVRYASASANARNLYDAASRVQGSVRTPLNVDGAATISLPAGVDPMRAAQTLRSMPGVVAAGPVVKRYALSSGFIPNDTDMGVLPYNMPNPTVQNLLIQWDMYVMNMPAAWALPTFFGSSAIRIAIIDTGYDKTNSDLKPGTRVAASVVYDLGTGLPDGSASVQDGNGHGTDVSGIAAADTNNSNDAAGVAGNVTLLEARVFPTPSAGNPNPGASTQDVAAAIHWAVSNGAKVISMSLGSTIADSTFEEPAVAFALANNVSVVAAAGNGNAQGIGQPTLDYPAADPGVIAVGASALCDGANPRNYGLSFEYVASYSNYLPSPSSSQYYVVAPGGDPSTLQTQCTTNACIDFLQWITNLYSNTAFGGGSENILIAGTSQATPHVAGLIALMLSKDNTLTPTQIAQIISNPAYTVNINDTRQGHGRVDANLVLSNTP
jgi:subtilisin family serine protease